MIRGTTARHVFTLPESMSEIEISALYITYQQHGKTILEKTLDDVQRDGNLITVQFTQAETLKFARGNLTAPVLIQIRLRTSDDKALASDIMRVSVGQILKDGEI